MNDKLMKRIFKNPNKAIRRQFGKLKTLLISKGKFNTADFAPVRESLDHHQDSILKLSFMERGKYAVMMHKIYDNIMNIVDDYKKEHDVTIESCVDLCETLFDVMDDAVESINDELEKEIENSIPKEELEKSKSRDNGGSPMDMFGGLFEMMNNGKGGKGGGNPFEDMLKGFGDMPMPNLDGEQPKEKEDTVVSDEVKVEDIAQSSGKAVFDDYTSVVPIHSDESAEFTPILSADDVTSSPINFTTKDDTSPDDNNEI